MRGELNKLALTVTASLSDAAVFLRQIPNDDPVSFSDTVIARIRSGKYHGRDIFLGTEKIGVTVYFVENFDGHREFVSVATYTNQKAPGFQRFWSTEIERLARRLSCQSIRFSTVRHGLVKLALADNWHVAEITVRKYFK